MVDDVTYQFEYAQRIRCAFVGAGEHAFRNVYPALQYAPVDLVAICDLRSDRATAYARLFGAEQVFGDYERMLAEVAPEAVFVVTGYSPDGRVQATDIAAGCVRAGAHVWMEKPTAASMAEIIDLQKAARVAGRFVMTGLKKIFTPAVEKAEQIISSAEFGSPTSISVRYPQDLPPESQRDLDSMRGFLDHIYHPAAVINFLMGPVERMSYEREPRAGGTVTTMRFCSGAIGTMHLVAGIAQTSPVERIEVIGRDANVVIDNGVTLTYYRPGARLAYGRSGSYVVADDVAPLVWQPEFSLGQLYNKNLFLLGYVPEIMHFCESVQAGRPPTKGTLDDSLEIMRIFEAYQHNPAGSSIVLRR